jgi:hypothetical protein
MLRGFAQQCLGRLQVQLDGLFHAVEGLGGQLEGSFDAGFLRGNHLFSSLHTGS